MKDKPIRYSRKAKVRLKDVFKQKNDMVATLDQSNKIPRQVKGWPLIFGYLGIFLIVAGCINLLPIIITFFYHNELSRIFAFLIPGVISIVIGFALSLLLRGKNKARLGKYQDLVLLILIWLVCINVCAIPFMMPDYIGDSGFRIGGLGLNYIQGLFETMSGFTTTGLTILGGDVSPSQLLINDGKCFLFFRSLMMFIGGAGFVLFLVSVISDVYGMRLFYSEGHTDRLLPNLFKTAKMIIAIYVGLLVFFSLLLWLVGMNEWTIINRPLGAENDPIRASYFEALCNSMTHLSSGGFATRDLSIYAYNNVAIEIVIMMEMLAAGTNFLILFNLLNLKFKRAINDIEIKTEYIFAAIFIPILVLISAITPSVDGTFLTINQNIRYNVFTFISASTTTGSNNTFSMNSAFSSSGLFLFTLIMAFGCQMGSTCGGIKFYRIGLSIKSIWWTIKEKNFRNNLIYPHYVTRFGGAKEIDNKEVKDAYTYIFLHFIILFICAVLIQVATGNTYSLLDCLFESSSALSDSGLSTGITSLNQNSFVLTVLTFEMFVGRLEIYTFIYGTMRIIYDIGRLWKMKVLKKQVIE